VSPPVLHRNVLTIDIAEVAECATECRDIRLVRILWFRRDQNTDTRHFLSLLGRDCERRS